MTPRPTVQRPTSDPFADGNSRAVKPAAMARASDYTPASDQFYLKDIEGREVAIHVITPGTDDYGNCVDLTVVCDGEEEPVMVHVSGFLAGRLIGLRGRIETGECAYPLAARFEKLQIAGGKTVWSMS